MTKEVSKIFKLKGECKATIEILIREVQDCQSIEDIKALLDCWIKANDLHPENVLSLPVIPDGAMPEVIQRDGEEYLEGYWESETKTEENRLLSLNEGLDVMEEAECRAWQIGIRWVGLTFAKNMTLKEIMETDFWQNAIKPRMMDDSRNE